MVSRLAYALLWALHFLPLPWLAACGRGVGVLLYRFGRARRHVAQRNLKLCFPHWTAAHREAVVREHFHYLGRSILERGLLWHASKERLQRLIQIEGDVHFAERSERPVMWIVPHFLGLEVAGVALQLFQTRPGVDIYQPQSDPFWDEVMKRGRLRLGIAEAHPRGASIRPVIKRIKEGWAFFNMPDMDFGERDAAFVPFFGMPAATLLAPSRMARALNMATQAVVVEMLPHGQGYRVRLSEPFTEFPTDDPVADTRWLNEWIEAQVLHHPAQYLWVHKRFKTRPSGQPKVY